MNPKIKYLYKLSKTKYKIRRYYKFTGIENVITKFFGIMLMEFSFFKQTKFSRVAREILYSEKFEGNKHYFQINGKYFGFFER